MKKNSTLDLITKTPLLHLDKITNGIITVTDKEVEEMTRRLSAEQGLYVGYSSGANVKAALKYLEMTKSDKIIVTILCDYGYKYTDL